MFALLTLLALGLVHAGHGKHTDLHPVFKPDDLFYNPRQADLVPHPICSTYMTTVLITIPFKPSTTVTGGSTSLARPTRDPGGTDPKQPSSLTYDHSTITTPTRSMEHSRIQTEKTATVHVSSTEIVQPAAVLQPMLPVVIGIKNVEEGEAGGASSGFIGNSTVSNPQDCSQAHIFLQGNGRLQSFGRPLSVDPGVRYIDITHFPTGTITSSLDVVDGLLVWRNSTFFRGTAGYCQGTDGDVYATFTDLGGPPGCKSIQLAVYSALDCRAGAIVSPSVTTALIFPTLTSTSTTGSPAFLESTLITLISSRLSSSILSSLGSGTQIASSTESQSILNGASAPSPDTRTSVPDNNGDALFTITSSSASSTVTNQQSPLQSPGSSGDIEVSISSLDSPSQSAISESPTTVSSVAALPSSGDSSSARPSSASRSSISEILRSTSTLQFGQSQGSPTTLTDTLLLDLAPSITPSDTGISSASDAPNLEPNLGTISFPASVPPIVLPPPSASPDTAVPANNLNNPNSASGSSSPSTTSVPPTRTVTRRRSSTRKGRTTSIISVQSQNLVPVQSPAKSQASTSLKPTESEKATSTSNLFAGDPSSPIATPLSRSGTAPSTSISRVSTANQSGSATISASGTLAVSRGASGGGSVSANSTPDTLTPGRSATAEEGSSAISVSLTSGKNIESSSVTTEADSSPSSTTTSVAETTTKAGRPANKNGPVILIGGATRNTQQTSTSSTTRGASPTSTRSTSESRGTVSVPSSTTSASAGIPAILPQPSESDNSDITTASLSSSVNQATEIAFGTGGTVGESKMIPSQSVELHASSTPQSVSSFQTSVEDPALSSPAVVGVPSATKDEPDEFSLLVSTLGTATIGSTTVLVSPPSQPVAQSLTNAQDASFSVATSPGETDLVSGDVGTAPAIASPSSSALSSILESIASPSQTLDGESSSITSTVAATPEAGQPSVPIAGTPVAASLSSIASSAELTVAFTPLVTSPSTTTISLLSTGTDTGIQSAIISGVSESTSFPMTGTISSSMESDVASVESLRLTMTAQSTSSINISVPDESAGGPATLVSKTQAKQSDMPNPTSVVPNRAEVTTTSGILLSQTTTLTASTAFGSPTVTSPPPPLEISAALSASVAISVQTSISTAPTSDKPGIGLSVEISIGLSPDPSTSSSTVSQSLQTTDTELNEPSASTLSTTSTPLDSVASLTKSTLTQASGSEPTGLQTGLASQTNSPLVIVDTSSALGADTAPTLLLPSNSPTDAATENSATQRTGATTDMPTITASGTVTQIAIKTSSTGTTGIEISTRTTALAATNPSSPTSTIQVPTTLSVNTGNTANSQSPTTTTTALSTPSVTTAGSDRGITIGIIVSLQDTTTATIAKPTSSSTSSQPTHSSTRTATSTTSTATGGGGGGGGGLISVVTSVVGNLGKPTSTSKTTATSPKTTVGAQILVAYDPKPQEVYAEAHYL